MVAIAAACKLLLLPSLTAAALFVLGIGGTAYAVALLYASLPCSASAYVLALIVGALAIFYVGFVYRRFGAGGRA